MIRLLRRVALLGAVVVAAALALLQFFGRRGAPLTAAQSTAHRQAKAERVNVKRWIFRIAAFLVLAAFGGFLFAASGIMPIKASSGHWPITAWFLNFAMRRSVVTHSLAIKPPPLDDDALVLKGAGHYEIGCRPCHGSPDLTLLPRIAQWMTPQPPNLSREVPKWDAEELFYIVKHGVKFTGMPAWPAQNRDDEVWAMVAFLLKLPVLTADDYKRLARGEASTAGADAPMGDLLESEKPPLIVQENCARCHGADGGGRGLGAFPKLAGQKPQYFTASMQAYALGRRSSGIMEPIAVALSQENKAELARYYAALGSNSGIEKQQRSQAQIVESPPQSESQNPKSTQVSARTLLEGGASATGDRPASAVERGREIAMSGIPSQRVPACVECHGPSEFPRNPNYPVLAGQYADYLVLQLTLFKNQARGGTAYAHLMRPVAAGLTAEQMRDVAQFYESLQK
jgi:cytochrome c553